jgi:hypothetical protein
MRARGLPVLSPQRNQKSARVQGHAGLDAYGVVYQATCLESSNTGNYDFAEVTTSKYNPTGEYPYYLAVGLNLLTGKLPSM